MRRPLSCLRFLPLLLLVLTPLPSLAQDGSSELIGEKPLSTLGSRLRVRCTDDSLRLYANATACADEREPESCRMVFTTTASSNPAARDPKCDNPLLKDLADQCRRTCAICCEDPAYACQNDESGIVNCNQNMEKCGMSEFSAMMIKFCPATCGLCLAKRCRDQIDDCEAMRSLCTNEIYRTFMEHQCSRTCGLCKGDEEDREDGSEEEGGGGGKGTKKGDNGNSDEESEEDDEDKPRHRGKGGGGRGGGSGSTKDETCFDVMKNCHRNKKFCRHPNYMEMMKKNCAKTCGYCKPGQGGGGGGGGSGGGTSGAKNRGGAGSGSTAGPTRNISTRECKDNHPFCKGWAANGYCESEEYTDEEKKDKCAKTCGYC